MSQPDSFTGSWGSFLGSGIDLAHRLVDVACLIPHVEDAHEYLEDAHEYRVAAREFIDCIVNLASIVELDAKEREFIEGELNRLREHLRSD
ncbi:MAG: hypothetical protein JOY54_03555 [Acidobacteriaceae bacterium]|nr:hypothetical protein [Acidobacteriaceae bacterium]